jgi:hypothetical protein
MHYTCPLSVSSSDISLNGMAVFRNHSETAVLVLTYAQTKLPFIVTKMYKQQPIGNSGINIKTSISFPFIDIMNISVIMKFIQLFL